MALELGEAGEASKLAGTMHQDISSKLGAANLLTNLLAYLKDQYNAIAAISVDSRS